MSTISLKHYITKIESKYTKYLEEWEKVAKKIDDEQEDFKKFMDNKNKYSPLGISERQTEHHSSIKALKEELGEIKAKFEVECEAIKKQSDLIFDKKYKYDPSQIDSNGVYLLQNSAMSIDERIDLAESYKDKNNYTMYYLVADSLKEEVDKPTDVRTPEEARGAACYQASRRVRDLRPDHEIIDIVKEWCSFCLDVTTPMSEAFKDRGEDRGLNLDSVRYMRAARDEKMEQVLEVSDEVTAITDSPWD